MDDTVILRHHAVMGKSELGCILGEGVHLLTRNGILDRFVLIVCRCIVIGHTEYLLGAETFQSACTHAVECLRRCYLVTVQAVDIQLRRTSLHLLHHVLIPYLIKECIHF